MNKNRRLLMLLTVWQVSVLGVAGQIDTGTYSLELTETKTPLDKSPNKVYSHTNEIVGNYRNIETGDNYEKVKTANGHKTLKTGKAFKKVITFHNGVTVETEPLDYAYLLPDSVIAVAGFSKDFWNFEKTYTRDSMLRYKLYLQRIDTDCFQYYRLMFYNTKGEVLNEYCYPTTLSGNYLDISRDGNVFLGIYYSKATHLYHYTKTGKLIWEKHNEENISIHENAISPHAEYFAFKKYNGLTKKHAIVLLDSLGNQIFENQIDGMSFTFSFSSNSDYLILRNLQKIYLYNTDNFNIDYELAGQGLVPENCDVLKEEKLFIFYKGGSKIGIIDLCANKQIFLKDFEITTTINTEMQKKRINFDNTTKSIEVSTHKKLYNFTLIKK